MVKQFIERVLLDDLRRMVYECRLHYLSFGLIVQAIEFLGACLDELPWAEESQSEKRFNKAMRRLFGREYESYLSPQSAHYLYQRLRCGLVHTFRPQHAVLVSDRAEAEKEGTCHLQILDDSVLLIVEDLYDDLEKASRRLIKLIDRRKLTNQKVYGPYLKLTDRSQDQAEGR